MGGSVLQGVVVFCVLLIVNFIVITKGAGPDGRGRRALRAGRDAGQTAGHRRGYVGRRHRPCRGQARGANVEQAETTFFGSLDGASKFVKGDAVAGLLITLLNIVVGLIIGVSVHGMPLGMAFKTYAILTVGDGLVSQIPAVIISIARRCCWRAAARPGPPTLRCFASSGAIRRR